MTAPERDNAEVARQIMKKRERARLFGALLQFVADGIKSETLDAWGEDGVIFIQCGPHHLILGEMEPNVFAFGIQSLGWWTESPRDRCRFLYRMLWAKIPDNLKFKFDVTPKAEPTA